MVCFLTKEAVSGWGDKGGHKADMTNNEWIGVREMSCSKSIQEFIFT